MQERLKELQTETIGLIDAASDLKQLNDVRVAYLGKKGPITEVLRGMGKLSEEERPKMGALVNEVREVISTKITEKQSALEAAVINEKQKKKKIDVSLPGRP